MIRTSHRARLFGATRRAGLLALPRSAAVAAGRRPPRPASAEQRAALAGYVSQSSRCRLAVNRLLIGADPILSANHDKRISPAQASLRMGALERHFAAYTVDIAAIRPPTPALRALHDVYAHTYVLEDSYLSALTTGLGESELDELPNTESNSARRSSSGAGPGSAGRRAGYALPADLQVAGRGEIRPDPDGS